MTTLRFFDLNKYIDTYGVRHFIETGTYKGSDLSYALGFGFEDFWSIEYWKPTFDEVLPRFAGHPNVHLVNGHSPDILRLLCFLQEPCLFWLDAHFPNSDAGVDTGLSKNIMFPLEDELKVIAKHREGKDVILIDDLCLFEDGTEGGNVETKLDIDLSPFVDSHVINRYMSTSGYLEMVPR